jgi:hypothetical protein
VTTEPKLPIPEKLGAGLTISRSFFKQSRIVEGAKDGCSQVVIATDPGVITFK